MSTDGLNQYNNYPSLRGHELNYLKEVLRCQTHPKEVTSDEKKIYVAKRRIHEASFILMKLHVAKGVRTTSKVDWPINKCHRNRIKPNKTWRSQMMDLDHLEGAS